jgi:hypothetical protein
VLLVGGRLAYGALAGFFCLYAAYSSPNDNSLFGSRLAAYV